MVRRLSGAAICGSAGECEFSDHADTERESVERDALVDAVEEPSVVELVGHAQSLDPIAADPQLGYSLRIRSTWIAVWNGVAVGILGPDRLAHGVDEPSLERCLHCDVLVDEFACDAIGEEPVDLGKERVFLAGKEAPVDAANPTTLEAGYQTNVIPGQATASTGKSW